MMRGFLQIAFAILSSTRRPIASCVCAAQRRYSQVTQVAVARGELDTLVVVLERVEDVAEELLRNATDVVQVHLLQLTIVLFQFLQHLLRFDIIGWVGLKILQRVSVGFHNKVLWVGV